MSFQIHDDLPALERELATFTLLVEYAADQFRGNSLRVIDRDAGEVLIARSSKRTGRVVARVYAIEGGARIRTIIAGNR